MPSPTSAPIGREELVDLCRRALLAVGADARAAEVLASATVEAEAGGTRAVGVAHLFDYLDGYRRGRIAAGSRPQVRHPAAGVLDIDARDGLAQVAYAAGADELSAMARECGAATLWIRGSFTCGELGWYVRDCGRRGLIAVAAATSPALMSLGGSPRPVLGTNPIAYAVPRPSGEPLVIDQASSATAYVTIRRAAGAGEPIPPGWALGPDGGPTEDARAALAGTLLPFGGHRGGNLALLVELLATLSGAEFSVDAPPFDRGADPPRIGLFLLVVDAGLFPGSADRVVGHLGRLRAGHGVRLPALEDRPASDVVAVEVALLRRLRDATDASPGG